jgi:CBS domain-containing protein
LPLLLHTESSGLPVLSDDGMTVVGWLTHRDVLHAYQARLRPATDSTFRSMASSP